MKNILTSLVLLIITGVFAQEKVTVEDVYNKGTFSQRSVYNINWMNDGQYYSVIEGNDIVKYDVTTGKPVETILKGADLSMSIQFTEYSFSKDEQKVLLMTNQEMIYRRSYTADFYVYDFKSKKLEKLSGKGEQSYATFSPDGSKVGFTRKNNLFYVTLADMKEVQVTDDGKFNHIINGSSDWVYEEELYLTNAFDWSADGKKLAYIIFDESKVREYNLQKWNHGQLYPEDYRYKYPKAGEKNSEVSLSIYHLDDGKKINVDLGSEKDIYLARINWTKDANTLSYRMLNRLQNKLDYYHANANNGSSKLILTDQSDTYVDLTCIDDLIYLDDNKHFITASERSGYKHLYLYTTAGQLVRQITNGDWGVETFVGIDQSKKKTLYYISTEVSPLDRDFYQIGLNGKGKKKLSTVAGSTRVSMSNDFKYYINYHSNASTPLNVSLYQTSGNKQVKVLEDNKKLQDNIKEYGLSPKEFITVKSADGMDLNGFMLKPADFDESKKYPMMMFQYSGPGSQQVRNSWGSSNYYWHQMLVQKGYIVTVVDGRGTGGRGTKFKKMTYRQMGTMEVDDQIAVAKEMGTRLYVDEERIGIWGWSYGGYMSSMCMLRGADVFKAGIGVAPFSWEYYDTIYSERYMQRPEDNESGYKSSSLVNYADKLKGNYFLIHGTGDDNVHFQISMAFQQALIDEGKQFDSFYYPDNAHGIFRGGVRLHLFTMMTNWVLENL